MSLVILVTSEPVVNRSVCSIERDMTLAYAVLLKSFPKPCEADAAVQAQKVPKNPPTTVTASISTPNRMTIPRRSA